MSRRQDASRRATTRHPATYCCGVRTKKDKWARTPPLSQSAVYTFSCVAILVMQSDLSSLLVATKVPSREIAHALTCKHKQHQTSSTSKARKSYSLCVRCNSRLLDQLMRHCVHHSSLFPFLQPQQRPTRDARAARENKRTVL